MASKSLLRVFFPVEAYPVVVPVALAGALFTWMTTRTIAADPDGHAKARAGLGVLDEAVATAEQRGEGWRGSVRDHFKGRIAAGATSIFSNKV